MFLQTLKTLMAKLKASDWGALDRKLSQEISCSIILDLAFQKTLLLIVHRHCRIS